MDLLSVGYQLRAWRETNAAYVEELSNLAPIYISCHPNAGLPNAFGGFDETPESMSADMLDFASNGWLNITVMLRNHSRAYPCHCRSGSRSAAACALQAERFTRFSGLEPLVLRTDSRFVNIGERTNVTGSPKFPN